MFISRASTASSLVDIVRDDKPVETRGVQNERVKASPPSGNAYVVRVSYVLSFQKFHWS